MDKEDRERLIRIDERTENFTKRMDNHGDRLRDLEIGATDKATVLALENHRSDLGAHGAGAIAKGVGLLGGIAVVIGALWKGFVAIGHR